MILTVTLNAAIDKRYRMKKLRLGEVNRVSQCQCSAGGKGLNVARVAAIAGESVTAFGLAGGHTGKLLEELAGKDGIRTAFVQTSGESRTCLNILDETTGLQTELLEGGMEISDEEVGQMERRYRELLRETDAVVLSGSLPPGVEADLYVRMILEAKRASVPVLLDTSGPVLRECVKAAPSMIKPNQDEIRQLTGRAELSRKDLLQAAEQLGKRGISYVVISLGQEGAVMATSSGVYQAAVPGIEAVNTVGCGDAMMAGFAIGLKNHWDPSEILRYASALAAANARQERTGYFVKEEFEELYEEILVQKL